MASYLPLLLLVVSMGNAQFYMYQPGTKANFSPWDQFGRMIPCSFEIPSGPCQLYPYFDASLCTYTPPNVSVTPSIDQTYRYGSASDTGGIIVDCNVGNRGTNVSIAYTEDGTLPDIKKAVRRDTVIIRFNATRPTPIIIARCIDQGKVPSRIAYMQRMIWDDAVNGSYSTTVCNISHYKELNLPRCDPNLYGSLCDGQSIVNNTWTTTPSPKQSNIQQPTHTPLPENPSPVRILKSDAHVPFIKNVMILMFLFQCFC